MINTPIIVCSEFDLLESADFFCFDEIIFALLIDHVNCIDRLSVDDIHKSQILSENNSFSIYLDFSKQDFFSNNTSYFKELVLHCFFHPKYKIIANKPLLCLDSYVSKSISEMEFINELECYATKQGYDGLEVVFFSEENIQGKEHILFRSNVPLNTISSSYSELLKEKYYCSKFIGIWYQNAKQCIDEFNKIEAHLLKESVNKFNHLKEYYELKKTLVRLNTQIKTTQYDLENQKKYLNIYKNYDESQKIVNFYYNEYEILPLWYKKLGHIIKVMMGKRTFLSLFDNNVKKYKD